MPQDVWMVAVTLPCPLPAGDSETEAPAPWMEILPELLHDTVALGGKFVSVACEVLQRSVGKVESTTAFGISTLIFLEMTVVSQGVVIRAVRVATPLPVGISLIPTGV